MTQNFAAIKIGYDVMTGSLSLLMLQANNRSHLLDYRYEMVHNKLYKWAVYKDRVLIITSV